METKLSFEFSAMERKVVIKQLATAAVNKCSGDQIPSIPLGKFGGVATSNLLFNSGELIVPLRSLFHSYIYIISVRFHVIVF